MPRNKYPEETVEKILNVSFELFMKKGYENTTVLDIVNNLGGLTRGAFYHHFKSKEEVMDALSDRMFNEYNPFELVKKEKTLNGLQKLQKILKDTTVESDYRKIMAEALPLLQNPKFLAGFIESNRDVLVPAYQELIEEGVADGSIQTEYPKQTAEILAFLTNFWMVPTIFPYDAEEGIARMRMTKKIAEFMGVPIIEDELLEEIEHVLRASEPKEILKMEESARE